MASEPSLEVGSLLVRGLNWIGDAVMSLPTIGNLREALPEARIAVLSPGWSSGVYKLYPAVDEVLEAPQRRGGIGILSEWALAGQLRGRQFDAALVLPNSFRSAVAPLLARIGQRWGYRTDWRGPLLSRAVRLPREVEREHTIFYYRPLLREIGVPWRDERCELKLSDEIVDETEAILRQRGVETGRIRAGFSPGAAFGPSKRWPAERFARVARMLSESHGVQPLVFGSEAEGPLAEAVADAAGHGAANLAGAFPEARHLAAAIATCALLVTNDSGPMHIAAALAVPVVALFGPTDERRSGPWGVGDSIVISRHPKCRPCYNPRCDEKGWPCMEAIGVEEVAEAAGTLLGAQTGRD